ncbi:uncharacterized protein N7498_003521 [Penicillium cinerascens]|uniref:FHA domain-containing protein n=1 Tax=Penicillium cinerascens TaxID=70096 RepID=A0A9W9N2D7_9EURO|nr:uncharacterized protein N7498_003521 [Penicillium cinerascens]KAJ5211875.1 hypothetical protein N7498_003521 [Penicillium cinerascens]
MSDVQVSVVLSPVNFDAKVSLVRSFTLSTSEPSIEIGRCSKRGLRNRTPAKDNAWFDSRVMSRDHAELSISLETKNLYICDYGSTHGTWINKSRLITGEKMPLIHGDILTFGVPVDREDETYPALAVRCKFDWIYEGPTSDEVSVNHSVAEPITPPASKLRPSTSTNTFCAPEDDSDVEEPIKITAAMMQRNFSHPSEPICVIEDEETVLETVHEERHMKEESKASGDPCFYHEDEVLGHQSDDSTSPNDEQGSELESSEPSSFINSNDGANSNAAGLEETGYYEYEQFSEEDCESDSVSDSEAQSGNEYSVNDDSYDDEEAYINDNAFVDPSMLLREKMREDAFISSVQSGISSVQSGLQDAGLQVKPEATESKSSVPTTNVPFHAEYNFQGPSFQPPPISAYDVNPWRLPNNFPPSLHTPYPRFDYADGPFSYKYGSVYAQNNVDSNPSSSLKEPSPVKEFSPALAPVSLKRKASDMETQDAQQPEAVIPASQPDLNSFPNAEVVDAISSALSESEPSNKRAKSSHSTSTAMAGYTATAVISALLGGLGTIALLAALPAEYFQ